MLGRGSRKLLLLLMLGSHLSGCELGEGVVCGSDMIEYPNRCALRNAWVNLYKYGPCPTATETTINCDTKYVPVCGRDAVTYGNVCRLNYFKVDLAYTGVCVNQVGPNNSYTVPNPPLNCDCSSAGFQPVCSASGLTLDNVCWLTCLNQVPQSQGYCPKPCGCDIRIYDPYCGTDGRTYDNECMIKCAGMTVFAKGQCAPAASGNCASCALISNPVCGKDGKTYKNLCEILCKKVAFASFGACRTPTTSTSCSRCDPNLSAPLCSTTGKTFKNQCLCDCTQGCVKYSDGACPNTDYNGHGKDPEILCL